MTKEILKLIPTMHSAQLLSHMYPKKKKRPVGDFMDVVVGTEFIKAESDLIGGMD